jgi:16S rRNA (guanine(527)-N(7))-methyltransferase RsmG
VTFRDLLAYEFDRAPRLCGLPESSAYKLSSQQLDLLEAHYNLMLRWNQRLNLTRIVGVEEAVRLHYVESLFLGVLLPTGAFSIADVGSGPGFPGIPLAVLRPECTVTLIESHQRKAVFLREASRGLKNVAILAQRAQDVKQNFDWTVSRAVSPEEVIGLSLSDHLALLIGQEDAARLDPSWKITPLPWGDARVAAIRE